MGNISASIEITGEFWTVTYKIYDVALIAMGDTMKIKNRFKNEHKTKKGTF